VFVELPHNARVAQQAPLVDRQDLEHADVLYVAKVKYSRQRCALALLIEGGRASSVAAHLVHADDARQRVHLYLKADRKWFAHVILGLQRRNKKVLVQLCQ